MALSQAEVAEKLNAEYVAGNLIVGERGDRVFVGKTIDGVFTITEEGEALLAALETAKPAAKKATKAEAAE